MRKTVRTNPKQPITVPVTRRALRARINRRLAVDDQELRATRGGPAAAVLGDYHIIGRGRGTIVSHHIDLEVLGRELKALAGHEHLLIDED